MTKKERKIKNLESQLIELGFQEKGRSLSFLKAELKRRLSPNYDDIRKIRLKNSQTFSKPAKVKSRIDITKLYKNSKSKFTEMKEELLALGFSAEKLDLVLSVRELKRLLKLTRSKKGISSLNRKNKRVKKAKSMNVFEKRTPYLPKKIINKRHFLFLKSRHGDVSVNYASIEKLLISVNKIKKTNRPSKNNNIINDYVALLKFIGNTEEEALEHKFDLLKKRSKKQKKVISRKNKKQIKKNPEERKNKKRNGNSIQDSGYKYKWRRLKPKVDIDKRKPMLWVSNDIISEVEEKHYFISQEYRILSDGSETIDFYTMRLALIAAGIITDHTKVQSRIVEKYIIFYSFVGIYSDNYDLAAKVYSFEKYQKEKKNELMEAKNNFLEFHELKEMVEYFKRNPEAISLLKVKEFSRILKSWNNTLENNNMLEERFCIVLSELLDNIFIMIKINEDKKSNNFGKIIHLTKKLQKTEKPRIRLAV